jgi:hypothetical protein
MANGKTKRKRLNGEIDCDADASEEYDVAIGVETSIGGRTKLTRDTHIRRNRIITTNVNTIQTPHSVPSKEKKKRKQVCFGSGH